MTTLADAGDGNGTEAERRAGLFGGSFDPVHRAHLALAAAALDALALDEVRFVPAGRPWQKTRALAAGDHRAAMLALATRDEPRFVVDRSELDRDGPSYTIDTVRALQAAHPRTRWFLLIGQDQHRRLHTWRDWRELLQRVTVAVAARPDAAADASVTRGDGLASMASTDAAAATVAATPHAVVPLPPIDVSSTEVRRRAAAGLNLSPLVPPAVAGYIESNGLYRPAIRS